ncbi:SpoIIE family protein phosphatase [Streptomyces sp. M19]
MLPGDLIPVNRVSAVLGNALMAGAGVVVAVLLRDRDELLARLRATGRRRSAPCCGPAAAQRHRGRRRVLRLLAAGRAGRRRHLRGHRHPVRHTGAHRRRTGQGLRTLGAGAAVLTAFREAAYHRRDLCDTVDAMEQGLLRHNASLAHEDGPRTADGSDPGWSGRGPGSGSGRGRRRGRGRGRGPGYGGTLRDRPGLRPGGARGAAGGRRRAGAAGVRRQRPRHAVPDPLRRHRQRTGAARAGLPLGLSPLADLPRTAWTFDIPADSRVFACTDGVTEAHRPGGSFFPVAERLTRWARLPTPNCCGGSGPIWRRTRAGDWATTRRPW